MCAMELFGWNDRFIIDIISRVHFFACLILLIYLDWLTVDRTLCEHCSCNGDINIFDDIRNQQFSDKR